jgi:hypothetical protein
MISETFLGIYFWGTYIWFLVGVLLIGIPATIQLYRIFKKK